MPGDLVVHSANPPPVEIVQPITRPMPATMVHARISALILHRSEGALCKYFMSSGSPNLPDRRYPM